MQDNYEIIAKKVSSISGISKEEVDRKVDEIRMKQSGLITKEGAAQIVASNLGVKLDSVRFKVAEIVEDMRRINIIGKVINIFPTREFNKNGRSGKVVNFVIADDSGSTRVVLWDAKHIMLIESEQIKKGDSVEIKDGYTKGKEIHLSSYSELSKSSAMINASIANESFDYSDIVNSSVGSGVKLRGSVVRVFEPRFFSVCPECNKKVIQSSDGFSCSEHGQVSPKEGALLSFVIDDGTESMRVVLFSEQLYKIFSIEKMKDSSLFVSAKKDFLGSEVVVEGFVRKNQMFNSIELTARNIEYVDPDVIIDALENQP